MRSDARIVLETMAEYWNDPQFLSDEYPEPQYHGDQVALVRAGRAEGKREGWVEALRWVSEQGALEYAGFADSRLDNIIDAKLAELEDEP